jgi:anti-sigma factor RsiW
MTQGSQLSNRDLERLSAYLDGALSEKEASRLEARLRDEPNLQQAFQELKGTAQMVASLPEVPLPRSFTLTPEMVGIRERPRVYPVLRLATALATFAFFAVVGVDAITSFTLKGALAPMAKEQVAMEAPAPAADAIATGETATEGLTLETYKMEQEEVPASEAPVVAAEAENEMDRAAPSGVLGLTEETEPLLPEEEKTEAPELLGTPTPAVSGTAAGEEAVAGDEVEPEATATAETQPTSTPLLTPTSIPIRRALRPEHRSMLRVAEFGLGGLALLLAGLTIWVARRG